MNDSKNGVANNDTGSERSMDKGKEQITIRSSAAEYLTYVASTGEQQDSIEMRYEDENIWLTQKMMAALYDVTAPTINEHIKKIFADSELQPEATIRKFRIVQSGCAAGEPGGQPLLPADDYCGGLQGQL